VEAALCDTRATPPSDSLLVHRAAAGDEEAFAALFHRFRNDVYRAARAITGNHDESLDVVQETFLKVHSALATWRSDAALRTWILRIGIRTAIDARRRVRRRAESLPAIEPSHDPRESMDHDALLQRLRDLVGRLKGRQALVLKLRLLDGWSTRDVAETLDLREANVRMQLSKALRRLKEML
jgi:RNA polymerase sigma-70 factor, ECF subfamily